MCTGRPPYCSDAQSIISFHTSIIDPIVGPFRGPPLWPKPGKSQLTTFQPARKNSRWTRAHRNP